MKIVQRILWILLAIFMIVSGVNHFIAPEFYDAMIPDFLPKSLANYAAGIAEIVLGIGLLIPKFREKSAWGIVILMIIFMPLHIWDLFKEQPAIGSKEAAIIRIPFQFVFIAWAWWVRKPIG
ncbi:MAG: MauE/DoxX family redox-associated membrane protein [Bacteroidota bacterium]